MFKAVFEIFHDGCWGSEIGVLFPDFHFSSIDVHWIDALVVHIVKVVGDSEKFEDILSYFSHRKDIPSLELLNRSETEMYVRILTRNILAHPHFSDKIFQHHCFTVEATLFKGKFEVWTLGASKKEHLVSVYEEIKKTNEIHVRYFSEKGLETHITQKQREAFIVAKHFGYYGWPRKKSVSEIAKHLNVPKTVFLSHLRKVESKILENFHL